MAICVISTTGTSVFFKASSDIQTEHQKFKTAKGVHLKAICYGNDFEGNDLYQRCIEYLRAEAKAVNPEIVLSKASAELNSLIHILKEEKTRSDQLHFLATATPDGALAARIVADFSKEYFNVETVKVHLIEGLQVNDGQMFQRDGVRNLISTIYIIIKDAPQGTYRRVFNPTGGFKGLVPYLTVIGMIEPNIELRYIYEQSASMITLGRIPLQFNFDLLADSYPALKRCREDYILEKELKQLLKLEAQESLVQHHAWSLFDQITEDDKTYFGINGLGTIVLEHFMLLDQTKIYLSDQAAKRYDKLDRTQQKKFDDYFGRLREPSWIDAHRHDEYSNQGNAIPIKPGNVDERLFIYHQEDGSILIAELAFHRTNQEYDRVPQHREDYQQHRLWEN